MINSEMNVLNLIRCDYMEGRDGGNKKYFIVFARPTIGSLYITEDNPGFISGHVRASTRKNGGYPYNIPEMMDTVFRKEDNTIEVCSGMIKKFGYTCCFTVDINQKLNQT